MSSARRIRKFVHSSEQNAFCELMISARNEAGLTQATLAKRLDRPQSFIAKYENGERRVDVLEFVAIARAIGVDPIQLLGKLLNLPELSS